jgi:hypothetical protein
VQRLVQMWVVPAEPPKQNGVVGMG